ncbi:MAG: undecaprenyl-diphosphate phosphatase [Oligoflexales bacterium]|nr:undecaprenyl-diphosphate phosphatase [Oligoflexales bacterium]
MEALIKAALLGLVQGITEFLPISSSAHLIVASWWMNGDVLPLSLNVALHFGTLAALLFYFYRQWFELLMGLYRRVVYREVSFSSDTLFPALILGSIPAAILGLSLEKKLEELFHHPLTVCLPVAGVGIALWLADKKGASRKLLGDLSLKDAFLIGLAQSCALIPGVSRSGATILCARVLSYKRPDAAKFSFLLGTPAMAGAALLHVKDFWAYRTDSSFYVGVLSSCFVGCFAIHFFMKFITRFGFLPFAIYRVLFALLTLALVYS